MGSNWKDIMLVMLVVAILVILMRMSKVMQMQSETLLGVATKLGVAPPKRKVKEVEDDDDTEEAEEEEDEESEEEDVEEVEAEEVNERGEVLAPKTKIITIASPKTNSNSNNSEPKKSKKEIVDMIMFLFEDEIPRKRKDIEVALSIPNLKPGYLGDVISKLRDKGELGAQFVDKGDKWKSYYIFGMPEWFSNKNLKPEYEKKIKI